MFSFDCKPNKKKYIMKKTNLIFAFIVLFFAIAACNLKSSSEKKDEKPLGKLSFSNASAYNDFIIGEQEKIVKASLSLADAIRSRVNEDIRDSYKKFGIQAKWSLDTIKMMDAYNGNSSFRDEAIVFFQFYNNIYQKEYKRMIALVMKDADKVTDLDKSRLKQIQLSVAADENKLDNAFTQAQEKFASENNLKIEKNNLQNKIDKMK
jgi:hypothetical protein